MAESKIEWTDATWNPIAGCSVYSPGCKVCYAMRLAARLERMGIAKYAGLTDQTKAGAVWNGKINFDDQALLQPLRGKKPRRIFVNSMSDLFHESVPDEWIDQVFAVMALAPQHAFQVLTKRSARMRAYTADLNTPRRIARAILDMLIDGKLPNGLADAVEPWPVASVGDTDAPDDVTLLHFPLPNVWLGVSVEDQRRADERIPDLLATPAAVRFLSCEPLLEPVDIAWALSRNPMEIAAGFQRRGHFSPGLETLRPIDQVICGGESGPGARLMHPGGPRSLRDQCASNGCAFFFKQWGEHIPIYDSEGDRGQPTWEAADGGPVGRFDGVRAKVTAFDNPGRHEDGMARVGKKRAGRLLDGVEHNGMPGQVP